jgi:hypothetical protein
MAMRRNLTLLLLTTLAALLFVAVARALTTVNVTVNGTVTAGAALSVAPNGAAPTFALTLNGVDQTPTYTLAVSAIDPRGVAVGGGWNLTVTSTQFKDASGHTFPTTASTITAVTTGCGAGSTCTLPTNSVLNTNLGIPSAAVAPAAVKFLNAATATGLGTVNANATVSVAVPSNVFAGTYSSTVTVSIVAGP